MTALKEKTDKAQKSREIRENRREIIKYDNFSSFLPLAHLKRKFNQVKGNDRSRATKTGYFKNILQ